MKLFYFFIIFIIVISGSLIYSSNTFNKKNAINKLLRQIGRWATAANQDKNSMIAVLHANYGAGYLWALKDIFSEREIESVSGIKLKKIEEQVIKIQDKVTKRMAKVCPKYAPEPTILTKIAGEGN